MMVGALILQPMSFSNLCNQIISWAVMLSDTYSASVEDLATEVCHLLDQLIVKLATLKTDPEVERRVTGSPLQSASE